MILAVSLLLAAGAGRLVVMDETVQVPPRQWEAFNLELKQQPAIIECGYSTEGGRAGVRLSLMHRADMERFRSGVRHRVLAATEFQQSGRVRYGPASPGEYSVVLDNRLEGRGAARVHLTVSLVFPGGEPTARELPVARRWAVISLTLLYAAAVVLFAVRRLRGVLITL
jgi:hypothetical protein